MADFDAIYEASSDPGGNNANGGQGQSEAATSSTLSHPMASSSSSSSRGRRRGRSSSLGVEESNLGHATTSALASDQNSSSGFVLLDSSLPINERLNPEPIVIRGAGNITV